MTPNPKVSIGLPVFNGENYLRESITSVLSQTFTDFELIISDNASTDATQEICERFAASDDRIRYIRHEENLGAAWNFNNIVKVAKGDYFNWLAHDDKLAPDFLQECVNILDEDPGIILCFSKVHIIDDQNEIIEPFDVYMRSDSQKPSHRFYDLLMIWHDCLPIFGLIRRDTLLKTNLIGPYASGDHVLLAHLGLLGRFHTIPDYLFYSRRHPMQSNKQFNVWIDHHAYNEWFVHSHSPNGRNIFSQWKIMYDVFTLVRQSKLSMNERVACYLAATRWALRYRKLLFKELSLALKRVTSLPKTT